MFPYNFLSDQDIASCSGSCACYGLQWLPVFTQALDKHLSEVLITILNNENLLCSILLKFPHDEAELLRNRFYLCRCVVALNAKVIYRFEVIFLQKKSNI